MQNTFLRLILTFVRNVSRFITVTFSLEWLLNSRLRRNNLLLQIERPRSTIRVVRESISIKGSAVDLEKKESAPVRAVIKNTIFIWKKKRIISIDSSNENGVRHELEDLLKGSDVKIEDTLVTSVSVLLVVAVAYWITLPETADQLFQAITVEAQKSEPDLRRIRSELDQFLTRFPADERVESVASLQQQLRVTILEARMRRRVLGSRDVPGITRKVTHG